MPSERMRPDTRERIRLYLLSEPSFTVPFAVWELGYSDTAIRHVVKALLRSGGIEEIEPRDRRNNLSAVYQAKRQTKRGEPDLKLVTNGTSERELDDRELRWTTEGPA